MPRPLRTSAVFKCAHAAHARGHDGEDCSRNSLDSPTATAPIDRRNRPHCLVACISHSHASTYALHSKLHSSFPLIAPPPPPPPLPRAHPGFIPTSYPLHTHFTVLLHASPPLPTTRIDGFTRHNSKAPCTCPFGNFACGTMAIPTLRSSTPTRLSSPVRVHLTSATPHSNFPRRALPCSF